jgi:CubicO group peptidase (beta-lactamase class C family)
MTLRLIIKSLLLVFVTLSAQDKSQLIEYGNKFVKAIEVDSNEEKETIVKDIFSSETINTKGVDRILGLLEMLKSDLSPFEYHHSELAEFEMGAGNISRILHVYIRKKGSKFWKDIQLRLDPSPPHKIGQLGFIAEVAEPVNLPNGGITQEYTFNWLNDYINKLIEENELYGSILLTKGNNILLERYYGFEDIEKTRKITKNTSFNLGSGNKMFTSILIAKLVSEGKLKYEDNVIKYLPEFGISEKSKKVTLHQILTHTSGVGEYWTEEFEKEDPELNSLSDYLPFIMRENFVFEPGEDFMYCNSNFILSGLIIEKVTGQDYYKYVEENLFKPLNLNSTFHYTKSEYESGIAQPHSHDDNENWKLSEPPFKGSSAGGCYSNVRDIWEFSKKLISGDIISKKYVDKITTSKTNKIQDALGYAYGMIIEKHQDEISFGHGGTSYGVNFEYRYFPNLDITLVMFCNQDNGAYDDLKRNTIKLITGER